MMIRLTDKEICGLRGFEVDDEYPPSLQHYRGIANAQLKKVVEWLDERNHRKGTGFEDGCLLVYKKDWQALQDEAG